MNQRIWAPVDITRLLNHIKNNKTLEDISKKEKRSIATIQAKLKDIAVDLYFNKNMKYEQVQEITGIHKEDLLVKRSKPELTGFSKDIVSHGVQPIESIPTGYQIRLSRENPFSIESLSTLILSTVNICLLSNNG
jgi:hypothetical protein